MEYLKTLIGEFPSIVLAGAGISNGWRAHAQNCLSDTGLRTSILFFLHSEQITGATIMYYYKLN